MPPQEGKNKNYHESISHSNLNFRTDLDQGK